MRESMSLSEDVALQISDLWPGSPELLPRHPTRPPPRTPPAFSPPKREILHPPSIRNDLRFL